MMCSSTTSCNRSVLGARSVLGCTCFRALFCTALFCTALFIAALFISALFLAPLLFAQNIDQTQRSSRAKNTSVVIASSPEVSALARRLLDLASEGKPLSIKLLDHLDGAMDALKDKVVDGVIIGGIKRPHPHAIPIARTRVWWATRSDTRALSQAQWLEVLAGGEQPKTLQLCLRAIPDKLEEDWSDIYPEQARLIRQARRARRALLFYTEQELLDHLVTHDNAIALFDEGRLRLFGAPLAPIKVDQLSEISMGVWYISGHHVSAEPEALKEWRRFVRSGDHIPWLKDLGWSEP